MTIWADNLTSTADILGSEVASGEVRLNIGDVRDNLGEAKDVSMWGIDGFVSRPNDPDPDECARALYIVDGDEKVAIASQDNRYSDKVGTIEPGDRMIVSKGAQRFLMKQGTNSISLYTEDSSGESMVFSLDGSTGKALLSVGGTYISLDGDKIVLAADGGRTQLRIDSGGVQIDGQTFRCQTGVGYLGLTNGFEPPFPIISQGIGGPLPSISWFVAQI